MSKAIKISSRIYEELKEVSQSTGIPMSKLLEKAWEKEKNTHVENSLTKVTDGEDSKDKGVDMNLAGVFVVGIAFLFFYYLYERGKGANMKK